MVKRCEELVDFTSSAPACVNVATWRVSVPLGTPPLVPAHDVCNMHRTQIRAMAARFILPYEETPLTPESNT